MSNRHTYDSFISYASEDKEKIVEPLALKLRSANLKIWFDEFELKPGDSVSEKISKGLNSSKYGICVFSPSFINKPWPKFELKGMIQLLLANKMKIIPIWYNLSQKEILKFNPSLADIVGIKSDGNNIPNVFLKSLSVINPKTYDTILRKAAFDEVARNTQEEKMSIDDLQQADIKHKDLPSWAISRARLICKIFENTGSNFMNVETFIDNLKRDTHFEDELLIWEEMAYNYLGVILKYNLNLQQRREIFSILLGKSVGANEQEIIQEKKIPQEILVKKIIDKKVEKTLKKMKKKN